jgi:hypothetical protein
MLPGEVSIMVGNKTLYIKPSQNAQADVLLPHTGQFATIML